MQLPKKDNKSNPGTPKIGSTKETKEKLKEKTKTKSNQLLTTEENIALLCVQYMKYNIKELATTECGKTLMSLYIQPPQPRLTFLAAYTVVHRQRISTHLDKY